MYLDILAGYINDLSDMNTLGNFIYGTQTSFPTNFTVNNNKVDQKKKITFVQRHALWNIL